MFKRPSVHYGSTPQPVTPYQRAAQVWDERIGSARVQAKNWRLMAFGCLGLTATADQGSSTSKSLLSAERSANRVSPRAFHRRCARPAGRRHHTQAKLASG